MIEGVKILISATFVGELHQNSKEPTNQKRFLGSEQKIWEVIFPVFGKPIGLSLSYGLLTSSIL